MSKYNRHGSVISRQSDDSEGGDYWFKKFQESLQKGAVKSRREDNNLYDQINTIMNGKSKFKSVDAAVEDMKQRSGFAAHVDMSKQSENISAKKVASNLKELRAQVQQAFNEIKDDSEEPELFKNNMEIKQTLQNIVEDSSGTLDDVTVKERLRSLFSGQVSNQADFDDPEVLTYINKLQAEYKKPQVNESNNLGKRDHLNESDIDPRNDDMFLSLMPAKR